MAEDQAPPQQKKVEFEDCADKACLDDPNLKNYILNRDGNEEWMQDTWTLCKPKKEKKSDEDKSTE